MTSTTAIDDLAFELLLVPDSLEARLLLLQDEEEDGSKGEREEQAAKTKTLTHLGLLKKFLEWLQTERIRDAAAMAQQAAAVQQLQQLKQGGGPGATPGQPGLPPASGDTIDASSRPGTYL